MRVMEDIYSPEAELKRTLSTLINRIKLWNFGERMLNRSYRAKTIDDIKIDTSNKDEMDAYILSNNKRIDEIREHLRLAVIKKTKLHVPLGESA